MIVRLRAVVEEAEVVSDGTPDERPPGNEASGTEKENSVSSGGNRRHDPGPELVSILEEQHAAWRPLEHWLLVGGILVIILSFATDLFLVKLATI